MPNPPKEPRTGTKDPAALVQTQRLEAGQPQTIPEARRSGLKTDHKGHLATHTRASEGNNTMYDKGRDGPYAAFASRGDNVGNAP